MMMMYVQHVRNCTYSDNHTLDVNKHLNYRIECISHQSLHRFLTTKIHIPV